MQLAHGQHLRAWHLGNLRSSHLSLADYGAQQFKPQITFQSTDSLQLAAAATPRAVLVYPCNWGHGQCVSELLVLVISVCISIITDWTSASIHFILVFIFRFKVLSIILGSPICIGRMYSNREEAHGKTHGFHSDEDDLDFFLTSTSPLETGVNAFTWTRLLISRRLIVIW